VVQKVTSITGKVNEVANKINNAAPKVAQKVDKVAQKIYGVTGQVSQVVNKINQGAPTVVKKIENVAQKVSGVASKANAIAGKINQEAPNIIKKVEKISHQITSVAGKVNEATKKTGEQKVSNKVQNVVQKISGKVNGIAGKVDGVAKTVQNVVQKVSGKGDKVENAEGGDGEKKGNKSKNIFKKVVGTAMKVAGVVADPSKPLREVAVKVTGKVLDKVLPPKANNVVQKILKVASSVAEIAADPSEKLRELAAKVPETVLRKFIQKFGSTGRKITDKVKTVKNVDGYDVKNTTTPDDSPESKKKEYEKNVKYLKACLDGVGITNCDAAEEAANHAIALTDTLIMNGILKQGSEFRGQADAFRHCYWNAVMTRRLGPHKTKEVGDLHEVIGTDNQDSSDARMDLYNNKVGIEIGITAVSDDQAQASCFKAVHAGTLVVLEA
jgi:hypothetical protein